MVNYPAGTISHFSALIEKNNNKKKQKKKTNKKQKNNKTSMTRVPMVESIITKPFIQNKTLAECTKQHHTSREYVGRMISGYVKMFFFNSKSGE